MLKNPKTYLRAFEPADFLTTLAWHNDDEIWSTVIGPKYFVSAEYEKKWVQETIFNKEEIKLAVCRREDDRLIGMVSLTNFERLNRSAESSTMIGEKTCWGQGYGSDARLQMLEFGFEERGLHRIYSRILEHNLASRRLVEKCGAKLEGLLREAVFKGGRFHNVAVYSILRDEFIRFMEAYER